MTAGRRLPLSAAQRGVWFAHQLDRTGCKYTCAEHVVIEGAVDPDLFTRAWQVLWEETDVARVERVVDEDGPVQVVAPASDVPLPLVDLSGSDDPWAAAHDWMWSDISVPVDLAAGPVSAFALLKLSDRRFVFHYRMHHVVVDGYGVHLIGKRLAEVYSALAAGRTDPGPGFGPLSALLDEEDAYRSSSAFTEDRAHWARRFADAPDVMRVPSHDRAPDVRWPDRLRLTSRFATAPLRRAAEDLGVTWQVAFVAVVAAYLHRACGRRDVVIGLPVTGRRTGSARRVPGMVTNTVPLRFDVAPATTFTELVRAAGTEIRSALRHERYRLEDIRRDLAPGSGEGAFVGPMVNFMPFERELRFGDLRAVTRNLSSGPVVDLSIGVRGDAGADEVELVLEANQELHGHDGLAGHRDRFRPFAAALAAAPDRPIGSLDLLPPPERHELLVARNDTARAWPDRTVPEMVGEVDPGRDAVVAGGTRWTYGALLSRADGIAAVLRARGVGPDDVVAVALPRSPDLVAAFLGVLRAGAAYAPLDLGQPQERLRFVLDDLAPVCVLTSADARARLPRGLPEVLVEDVPGGSGTTARPDFATTAYVIYTSGSTGRPKGVSIPHLGMRNFVLDHRSRFGIDAHSRVLQFVTPSFDVATGDLWPVLTAGGTLVLAPDARDLSAHDLVGLMRAERVTHAAIPPVVLARLPKTDLPALRVLVTGGETPSGDAVSTWSGDRMMVNVYGVTEASVASTAGLPLRPGGPVSIGRPIANSRVYVLDPDLRPVPSGTGGELHVAGDGLARGYVRGPALTADRFLPCPFGPPGSRMYRTGDFARWRPDATLEYLGRLDDQLKVRGFRVEPGEVEAVLNSHPSVRASVAMLWGDRHLVAYVRAAPGRTADPAALRRFAAEALPDFMVPAAVVPVDRIPATANGKVDRAALPAPTFRSTADVEPDRSDDVLRALFAEVLGVDRVGSADSFFDLGGDSIGVLRLVTRAAEEGLALTPAAVFEHPRPADLAASAGAAPPDVAPFEQLTARWRAAVAAFDVTAAGPGDFPLVDLEQYEVDALVSRYPGLSDVLPLSPLQEGLLFHHALAEGSVDAYAAQLRFELEGAFDPGRMRRAAAVLLSRHPNLRAAFHHDDLRRPVQVVCEQVDVPWAEVDLGSLPEDERTAKADEVSDAERDRRFDVTDPPLLRFLVIRLQEQRHRLVLTAHHVLWDGWSTSIVVRELFASYAGAPLPPAPEYAAYLAWLRLQDVDAARVAWARALDGLTRPTVVATPGSSTRVPAQQPVRRELDEALTARLAARCLERGVTLNTAVEAAWAMLLARTTGSDDVVFGTSVSGRPPELPGVGDVVGLLANTVPVRVRLRAGESSTDLLRRLQAERSALIAHHHLGLAQIQRAAGTGELFDSAITFVNHSIDAREWASSAPGLRLAAFDVADGTHHALRLAAVPGRTLTLRLGHRPDLVRPALARRLADRLVQILGTLAD